MDLKLFLLNACGCKENVYLYSVIIKNNIMKNLTKVYFKEIKKGEIFRDQDGSRSFIKIDSDRAKCAWNKEDTLYGFSLYSIVVKNKS